MEDYAAKRNKSKKAKRKDYYQTSEIQMLQKSIREVIQKKKKLKKEIMLTLEIKIYQMQIGKEENDL